MNFLIEKSMELFDTDCIEIGVPMIEFLTEWIQSINKNPSRELTQQVGENILKILNIIIKRVAYPSWCDIEIEADDLQIEYQKYREVLKIILKNIALVKPCQQQFLQRIYETIDAVQPVSTPIRQAEVPLILMNEVHQCIPQEQREQSSDDNPYFALISHLFGRNFLEYDNHLTTVPFFEAIVKYANYFRDNEQFLTTVLGWFFSN